MMKHGLLLAEVSVPEQNCNGPFPVLSLRAGNVRQAEICPGFVWHQPLLVGYPGNATPVSSSKLSAELLSLTNIWSAA